MKRTIQAAHFPIYGDLHSQAILQLLGLPSVCLPLYFAGLVFEGEPPGSMSEDYRTGLHLENQGTWREI